LTAIGGSMATCFGVPYLRNKNLIEEINYWLVART